MWVQKTVFQAWRDRIHHILCFLPWLYFSYPSSFCVPFVVSSPLFKHFPALNLLFSSACLSVKSDSAQRPGPPRANPEDHGSLKAKNQSPNADKDKAARKKSSDSGEEADKEFILVWVRRTRDPISIFLFDIRGPARARNVEQEIFGRRDVLLYQVSQSLKFKVNWFSMMKLSLLTLGGGGPRSNFQPRHLENQTVWASFPQTFIFLFPSLHSGNLTWCIRLTADMIGQLN